MEIKEQGTVLLYFTAPWCGPCRQMAPTFTELTEKYSDKLTATKINVDDEPILSQKYRVSGIPTFIILKDGKETNRVKGAIPKTKLEEFIQNNI